MEFVPAAHTTTTTNSKKRSRPAEEDGSGILVLPKPKKMKGNSRVLEPASEECPRLSAAEVGSEILAKPIKAEPNSPVLLPPATKGFSRAERAEILPVKVGKTCIVPRGTYIDIQPRPGTIVYPKPKPVVRFRDPVTIENWALAREAGVDETKIPWGVLDGFLRFVLTLTITIVWEFVTYWHLG